jgi:hypothetical protein
MGRIFQQIDPWIRDDPQMVAATKSAPLARFLYTEGLLYIRRCGRDGTIPKYALGEVGADLPSVPRLVKALVEAGLWIDDGHMWTVKSWAAWNLTSAVKAEKREKKRIDGAKSAHRRWHSDSPDSNCEYCQEAVGQ